MHRAALSLIARSIAIVIAIVMLNLVGPRTAAANGRFPAANQLVGTPGKLDSLVLRTTFGIVVSSDGGKNWDWVCERAVGYGGIWDPPVGVFGSGAVMAGTIDGLALSPDHGCAWAFVTGLMDKKAIVDVVVRADAMNEGLALGSTSSGQDDAGAAVFTTQVFSTKDAGKSWSALASDFGPTFIAQTIEVAKSDPLRVYVSGSLGADGVVFVSSDGAKTFTSHGVALEKPSERAPYIAAVDPNNAQRVYVRTGGATSRLLVSDDGAQTFRGVFSGLPLPGFALSPDGSRVWVGSESGLFAANTTDLAFTQLSDAPVQCLFVNEARLYACAGSTTLPYILGASEDLGKTFVPVLTLKGIRGPLACAPGTAAATCAPDWPALRATLDPATTGDDAGADAGSPPPAAVGMMAGGGCNASGAGIRGGIAALAAALTFAVSRAARRRRAALHK